MKDKAQDALNSIKDGLIAKSDIDALQELIKRYDKLLIENKILLERIKRLEER